MYFGKPIPEWITKHKDDTITLGEIVDGCEKSKEVLEDLLQKNLDKADEHPACLQAAAYFMQKIDRVNDPVDMALSILGERYGYPDDAPGHVNR